MSAWPVSEPAPFGRQREGQQKVVGRDEPLHLTFQPLLALVVLTVRAKAMAAGMRHEVVVRTVTALNLHHRTGRAAAMLDRRQRLYLVKAQPVTKLRQEVGSEFGDDGSRGGSSGRLLGQVKRSISALIRSIGSHPSGVVVGGDWARREARCVPGLAGTAS
jgi:hypothetical protein